MSESTAMLVKRGYSGEGICRQGNNRHGGLTRERGKTRDRQNMSACFALTENCREWRGVAFRSSRENVFSLNPQFLLALSFFLSLSPYSFNRSPVERHYSSTLGTTFSILSGCHSISLFSLASARVSTMILTSIFWSTSHIEQAPVMFHFKKNFFLIF